MRRLRLADLAVEEILRKQDRLITRCQAVEAGLTPAALRHRLTQTRSWTVVLPGVYAAHTGPLSPSQREVAAVLHAGRTGVITGLAALSQYGIGQPRADVIDVLVPHQTRRQSAGFVRLRRTTRMPVSPSVMAGLRWAPPARAVFDAARDLSDMRQVRALVAETVQRRQCTVEQLGAELRAGPAQGSSALRMALEEVAAGIASLAEGDLRDLLRRNRVPEPMYNAKLFAGQEFLAQPDDWWPDAGVAGEVDSREWHLSPDQWERTMARHSRMSAHGIIVLHFTPRRIRRDPAGVVAEITSALEAGRRRPPLPIRAVPGR